MASSKSQKILDKSEARDKLRVAAARLFAEQGFSATGVQQITDAAGVNKAMLYYYFDSKDKLYEALINEGVWLIESSLSPAVVSKQDISERLRSFLNSYLTLALDHPEIAAIIFREAFGGVEPGRRKVAEHIRKTIEQMAGMMEDAAAAGRIRADIDPLMAAYSLLGIANMFISRLIVSKAAFETGSLVENIMDLFMRGVEARKE